MACLIYFDEQSPVFSVSIGSIQSHTVGSKYCWLKVSFVFWQVFLEEGTRLNDSPDLFFFSHCSGLQVWCSMHQVMHVCVALDTIRFFCEDIYFFYQITVVNFLGRLPTWVSLSLGGLKHAFSTVC